MITPNWFNYFLFYYFKTRFMGDRKPILAGFKLTHKCNLSCRHCPFWMRQYSQNLKFDQAIDILHKLYKSGIRLIIFEGGEPFMWRDGNYTAVDLILEAKKLFFSVGITTNGTFPIDVPANTVWISFDGLENTHNYIRGKPVFNEIINNIKSSHHPNIYANITINKINVKEVPELIKFLSKLVKGITIQFHYPYKDVDELITKKEDRHQVLDELINLKHQGYPVANSVAALNALKENKWHCYDFMLADVDPDGQINPGCYVKNRGNVMCQYCGFAAHTEISLAYELNIEAIITGKKIFHYQEK
ncbi:radical SAM protein [Candidatus Desantisbacteria bacterium]|nr:radical SAM protein [Candidatus Desantisbacteria bacterium]